MPARRPRLPLASSKGAALVTGAGKRLGATIAIALAAEGFDVAVHYARSRAEADETVDAIRRLGRRACALDCDLADENATRALIARASAELGPVHCLVNNASLFESDDATSLDYGTLEAHVRLNVAGPIVLARALHERLRARERGVVVNLLDQKLFNLNADYLSYTLSKAALHTATELLARALAPKLRVVGIAPGITLRSADQTRADFAKAHARTPLGRSSEPEDVASAVVFAATARAITGTTIVVDGGQHLVPSERDVMFLARA